MLRRAEMRVDAGLDTPRAAVLGRSVWRTRGRAALRIAPSEGHRATWKHGAGRGSVLTQARPGGSNAARRTSTAPGASTRDRRATLCAESKGRRSMYRGEPGGHCRRGSQGHRTTPVSAPVRACSPMTGVVRRTASLLVLPSRVRGATSAGAAGGHMVECEAQDAGQRHAPLRALPPRRVQIGTQAARASEAQTGRRCCSAELPVGAS